MDDLGANPGPAPWQHEGVGVDERKSR